MFVCQVHKCPPAETHTTTYPEVVLKYTFFFITKHAQQQRHSVMNSRQEGHFIVEHINIADNSFCLNPKKKSPRTWRQTFQKHFAIYQMFSLKL